MTRVTKITEDPDYYLNRLEKNTAAEAKVQGKKATKGGRFSRVLSDKVANIVAALNRIGTFLATGYMVNEASTREQLKDELAKMKQRVTLWNELKGKEGTDGGPSQNVLRDTNFLIQTDMAKLEKVFARLKSIVKKDKIVEVESLVQDVRANVKELVTWCQTTKYEKAKYDHPSSTASGRQQPETDEEASPADESPEEDTSRIVPQDDTGGHVPIEPVADPVLEDTVFEGEESILIVPRNRLREQEAPADEVEEEGWGSFGGEKVEGSSDDGFPESDDEIPELVYEVEGKDLSEEEYEALQKAGLGDDRSIPSGVESVDAEGDAPVSKHQEGEPEAGGVEGKKRRPFVETTLGRAMAERHAKAKAAEARVAQEVKALGIQQSKEARKLQGKKEAVLAQRVAALGKKRASAQPERAEWLAVAPHIDARVEATFQQVKEDVLKGMRDVIRKFVDKDKVHAMEANPILATEFKTLVDFIANPANDQKIKDMAARYPLHQVDSRLNVISESMKKIWKHVKRDFSIRSPRKGVLPPFPQDIQESLDLLRKRIEDQYEGPEKLPERLYEERAEDWSSRLYPEAMGADLLPKGIPAAPPVPGARPVSKKMRERYDTTLSASLEKGYNFEVDIEKLLKAAVGYAKVVLSDARLLCIKKKLKEDPIKNLEGNLNRLIARSDCKQVEKGRLKYELNQTQNAEAAASLQEQIRALDKEIAYREDIIKNHSSYIKKMKKFSDCIEYMEQVVAEKGANLSDKPNELAKAIKQLEEKAEYVWKIFLINESNASGNSTRVVKNREKARKAKQTALVALHKAKEGLEKRTAAFKHEVQAIVDKKVEARTNSVYKQLTKFWRQDLTNFQKMKEKLMQQKSGYLADLEKTWNSYVPRRGVRNPVNPKERLEAIQQRMGGGTFQFAKELSQEDRNKFFDILLAGQVSLDRLQEWIEPSLEGYHEIRLPSPPLPKLDDLTPYLRS